LFLKKPGILNNFLINIFFNAAPIKAKAFRFHFQLYMQTDSLVN